MTHNFSYDVFLSHNAKDKPRVRRLAERLQQAGLRVWFDEWTVRSGNINALKVDEGNELKWTHLGDYLISASKDCTVRIWSRQ
jgi:WD40 repeat protein